MGTERASMSPQTDQYGVVGHPVSHSWSPFIHALFARQTGQPIVYRLFDVAPADFRGRVLEFFTHGGRGLNITLPHKLAAAELANELTPRAERAGAVNTLAIRDGNQLLGDNTDGIGLVRDLRDNFGIAIADRRVLLIGAGGAARGVLGPLLALDPAELVVANRTVERARQLAADFDDLGPVTGRGFGELAPAAFDLVVNATAAGLSGDVPDITAGVIGPETVCYDIAYGRAETPFVRWAIERGCARAEQGWGMLVEQAAESFELWRGVRPETGA
ncbi:MAG TPA: shikimate dehydrogenase, partial [Steroidobacteraceae bacterium]|nr:shikimate dehydrogenase [Steroidobacteraceae bacterium]